MDSRTRSKIKTDWGQLNKIHKSQILMFVCMRNPKVMNSSDNNKNKVKFKNMKVIRKRNMIGKWSSNLLNILSIKRNNLQTKSYKKIGGNWRENTKKERRLCKNSKDKKRKKESKNNKKENRLRKKYRLSSKGSNKSAIVNIWKIRNRNKNGKKRRNNLKS